MSVFKLDSTEIIRLEQALKNFPGDGEKVINDVLHNEANLLIQKSIQELMPVSGRTWKGKKPAAKNAKSLTDLKENLSITVKSSNNYNYLYFPDDGSSTKKHAGNQQFFFQGAEAEQENIINLCIEKLVKGFEI